MSSLCHAVSAIFPPGQKSKTLREGVVTIDFGMNLLDVCCRNESLTATLILKSRLCVIGLSETRTLLPSSDQANRGCFVC